MKELVFLRFICILGALVSLLMVIRSKSAVDLMKKILMWKIKWCGFEGEIRPKQNTEKIIRIQCSILFFLFVLLAIFINF